MEFLENLSFIMWFWLSTNLLIGWMACVPSFWSTLRGYQNLNMGLRLVNLLWVVSTILMILEMIR